MATTASSFQPPPLPTRPTLFILLTTLCCLSLSGIATAQRLPSYHERFMAAIHTVAQAREAAALRNQPDSNLVCMERECAQSVGNEMTSLVRQLLDIEPAKLRQAVLDSVTRLSGRTDVIGKKTDVSSRSGSGLQDSGQAGKETFEEYETCINHTAAIVVGLVEKQQWALLMTDAMGKPLPALSQGNFMWPGAYDLCRSIRANTSVRSHPLFSGKYCNAYSLLSLNSALGQVVMILGLCVPDTCSDFDVTYIMNDVLAHLGIHQQFGVQCPQENPMETKVVVAIVICSILLVLIVAGTLADVLLVQRPSWAKNTPYMSANGHSSMDEHCPLIVKTDKSQLDMDREPSTAVKVLQAFSVYTNGSKLLCTKQTPGSITCIHGIRFLSMTWVVLGHSFLFPQSFSANTAPYIYNSLNRWPFQAISNALVAVDSFFVLSGLLVSYLTLKELQKKRGKLNWFMFYFHRFWRLTPAYMLVIMVYVCLSPYWFSGSTWNTQNPDRDNCADNWWTNLLYLNNFVKVKEMCLGQSWYLANDMQFYCVLSPLVIVPLYFFPIAGYVISGVLVLAHCVVSGVLTMHFVFPPGMFAQVKADNVDMADWSSNFYMKPYTRWGPYVIGMLAGYFLYITKCKLNIKWYVNMAAWALATGSALAVLYGLYGSCTGHPMTLSVSAFYNALNRNVWGVCVSWVVVACATGNGGFVNTLLSWPGVIPLSRLTYCIYLMHILIMDLYLGNKDSVFYFNDVNVVMFFMSVLVVSYMAATVASLAFEAPMMALEKVVFPRERKRDSNAQHQQQQQLDHCQQVQQHNAFVENK